MEDAGIAYGGDVIRYPLDDECGEVGELAGSSRSLEADGHRLAAA
jgi:hypothetical protein